MKKCVELLNEIKWVGCFSHTLQLVIGKGLFVIQNLILRVKRLIDFFMIPKQFERFEKIQKDHPSLAIYEENEEESIVYIYLNILLINIFNFILHIFFLFLIFRILLKLLNILILLLMFPPDRILVI